MAREISGTLLRFLSPQLSNPAIFCSAPSPSPSPLQLQLGLSYRSLSHRHRSSKSGKGQLVEVDLDTDGGSETEVRTVRKLEDAIHRIIVRRSAPVWLPFIPGSSYWVPPRPRCPPGVVNFVGKIMNPLSEEELLSLTTQRGWPSSVFLFEGSAPALPVPLQRQVELKLEDKLDDESESEDEEG